MWLSQSCLQPCITVFCCGDFSVGLGKYLFLQSFRVICQFSGKCNFSTNVWSCWSLSFLALRVPGSNLLSMGSLHEILVITYISKLNKTRKKIPEIKGWGMNYLWQKKEVRVRKPRSKQTLFGETINFLLLL